MAIWNVELTLTLRMPHVIAVEADDADRAQRMVARVLAHEVDVHAHNGYISSTLVATCSQ